jgi:hypothetical protein
MRRPTNDLVSRTTGTIPMVNPADAWAMLAVALYSTGHWIGGTVALALVAVQFIDR